MEKDIIVMISDSPLVGKIPVNSAFVFTWLHYFNVGIQTAIISIDYLFRWCLICRSVTTWNNFKLKSFRKKTLTYIQLIGALLFCFSIVAITASLFTFGFYENSRDPQRLRQYELVLLKDGDLWTSIEENGTFKLPTIVGAHSVRY
jgi:hypothetical protein